MKKFIFVLVMAVCAVAIIVTTPTVDFIDDFQLDNGLNKLMAAFMALILALAGAVLDIRKAVVALMVGIILSGCLCGMIPMFIFGAQFAIARLLSDDEIKDFILTPFKEE